MRNPCCTRPNLLAIFFCRTRFATRLPRDSVNYIAAQILVVEMLDSVSWRCSVLRGATIAHSPIDCLRGKMMFVHTSEVEAAVELHSVGLQYKSVSRGLYDVRIHFFCCQIYLSRPTSIKLCLHLDPPFGRYSVTLQLRRL